MEAYSVIVIPRIVRVKGIPVWCFTEAGKARSRGKDAKRPDYLIFDQPVRQIVVGAQGRDLACRVEISACRVRVLADSSANAASVKRPEDLAVNESVS